MKTETLTGSALDWAVAKAEGLKVGFVNTRNGPMPCIWEPSYEGDVDLPVPKYSTDWAQGGPIIERERISLRFWTNVTMVHAYTPNPREDDWASDPKSMLIAAMRAHVANKLGDEVDIPDNI